MQRRTFIKSTLVTTLALTFQSCGPSLKGHRAFYYPDVMMKCTDEEGLVKLGNRYREQHSTEQTEDILVKALSDGKDFSKTTDGTLQEHLADHIRQDFLQKNIVILDGWILSVTEARQCALFSLIA